MAIGYGQPCPKGRPAKLDREDAEAQRETLDEKESTKARKRAGGRCEVVVVGEGRCARRDLHTHHMISGWKLRARGPSALARHKQRTCLVCHADIEGNVLKRIPTGPLPVWTDQYERAR